MGAEVLVRERNLFIAGVVVCISLLCAIAAGAHEIGRTQAQASLRDCHYQVDIVVDPDALLPTLEAYGGLAVSRDLPRAERDRPLVARDRASVALAGCFLERVGVGFDGQRAQSSFEYLPSSAFGYLAQTPSTVRLRGSMPDKVVEFSFTYGLALGTYALNVRIGGSP